jgi:hypothetical protein
MFQYEVFENFGEEGSMTVARKLLDEGISSVNNILGRDYYSKIGDISKEFDLFKSYRIKYSYPFGNQKIGEKCLIVAKDSKIAIIVFAKNGQMGIARLMDLE